jgi:N-acetylmuramoyl-L-alanine amidase
MAHTQLAPIAVRHSQIVRLLAPVLILATLAGCSHRRSSMRPVYGTPVGGATVVTPVTPVTPVAPSGTITNEPDSSEPYLTPAPGASTGGGSGVIRAGGSPPVAPEATEPPLNTPTPPGASSNTPGGIEMIKPSALRSTGRNASATTRSPRVALREAVVPFVAEPNDLLQPPKADRPWKYVVVHHSANEKGGLDQIDRDHRKVLGFEGCGYHFVIGNGTDSPDGQIEVADRWLSQKHGVHCRNGKTADVNEYGIGICLVGNFDQSEPTPKQIAAAKALVAYLGDRYQIPTDHIGSHDQFADGPTACPGKNFPSQAIFGSKHMAAR